MPKLQIDGQLVEVPEGSSLLDAIKTAEGTLPHLCKPDAREPLGACRTCLVEISGSPRLTAACHTPAIDGQEILTNSCNLMYRNGVFLPQYLYLSLWWAIDLESPCHWLMHMLK